MELHHSKHHQTYVTNLNKALSDLAAAVQANDIDKQIALQPAINFNGGGHINHSLFWQNLAPASSPEASRPEESAPTLVAEINQTWGSLDSFKQAFSAKLLGIQGSGWGWLVKAEGAGGKKALQIVTTKDQDPVPSTFVPIFGVDMWEHAYYLQVSSHPISVPQSKRPAATPCGFDVLDYVSDSFAGSTLTARRRMWRTSGRLSTGVRQRADSSVLVQMLSKYLKLL